jgi:predicted kinase
MQRPELIIFAGLPAAGKSTYYLAHFASTHVQVSKDLIPRSARSEVRQRNDIDTALASGKSVVVDNTNPSPAARATLIALGRRHGARVIAYYFEIDVKTSLARNRLRERNARVPDVAVFVTRKKLVAPAVEEGFDEVVVVRM